MPTIAIVGASLDRAKYGNKAVRAYAARGYTVYPVHPSALEVEGHPAFPSLADVPRPLDMVSFYVPPAIGVTLLDAVRDTGAPQLWLNPGSESDELVAKARSLGISPTVACSIVAVGESPYTY